ncbi:MAG: HAD-IIIC family phosphatase [Lachnospiraceae bacterium]|nr:HAD-IIIC family phosphatase [Lachnospiraceae bacterium]
MKELNYPFDAGYILKKKKSIKRELLSDGSERIKKKIAILGGYTTSDIKLITELFLLDNGIEPEFYESEYNAFYRDGAFDNPELAAFAPDVIYVCTSNRNITDYPSVSDSAEDTDRLLTNEKEKFTTLWESLSSRYHCPIIQNNFEKPLCRLMGNRDAWDIHGKVNFLTRLNLFFADYAATHDNFYLCDIDYISADYGLKEWSDPFYYHMYKYAVNVNAIPYLAFNVANIIKSIFGKNKKGLVLDLDNTLWGGIVGDDGVENLAIGPEESEGQVFTEFQRYLKEQTSIGVILNVDSKNDEENAVAGLKHPDSVLSPEDFIVLKANWEPKDLNFKEIASTLDLLPESLVFVDDNPAERHIVREQLKGVIAPEIGNPSEYILNIDRGGYFETTSLSADDLARNGMYKSNAGRKALEASFTDYRDYLLSLEMKGTLKPFEDMYIARIAQLSNKSNQFNLTTKRYTPEEIAARAQSDEYITLYGKLEDRFGDNGVVSVAIGHVSGDECDIELWLMSCRVLKRDMEFAMTDAFVKMCAKRGIRTIRGHYYPTKKNGMVRNFFSDMGYTLVSEDENGNREYVLMTEGYVNRNSVIEVN